MPHTTQNVRPLFFFGHSSSLLYSNKEVRPYLKKSVTTTKRLSHYLYQITIDDDDDGSVVGGEPEEGHVSLATVLL